MGNKVIKSVSFNVTVAEDAAMLKHFKRRNFSGYVKKLILADMGRTAAVELTVEESAATPAPITKPLSSREKLDQLKKKQRSEPAPPKLTIPQRRD